jgi:hypothetical protein
MSACAAQQKKKPRFKSCAKEVRQRKRRSSHAPPPPPRYPKLSRLARLLEHKDGSGNSGEGDVEEEGETAKMTDEDTAL